MTLAELEVVLRVKDQMSGALKQAADATGVLSKKLDGLVEKVAGGLSFGAGARAAMEFGKAIADLGAKAEKIGNISKQTGLAVESVQQLGRAMKGSGGSIEQLTTGLKFLQQNLVKGAPAFAALGLSVEKLKAAKPEEQLKLWAQAMLSVKDPAERTAAAMATAGRSGTELLPVLDQLTDSSSRLALALSGEQVDALSALDDELDAAGGAWEDLRDQFLAAVAGSPAVVNAVHLIADAIRSIAEAVQAAAPMIQSFVTNVVGGIATAGAKFSAFVDEIKRGHGVMAALEAAKGTTFNISTPVSSSAASRQQSIGRSFALPNKEAEEAAKKAQKAIDDWESTLLDADKTFHKQAMETWKDWEKGADVAQQRAIDNYFKMEEERVRAYNAAQDVIDAETNAAFEEAGRKTAEAASKINDALSGVADFFGSMAGSGEDAFSRVARAASVAAQAILNVRAAGGLGTAKGKGAAAAGALDVASTFFGPDSKKGAALQGASQGAAIGTGILPGWGTAIGAGVGAIVGFIKKKKELEKELKSMKQAFIDSAGGLDALKKKAAEAGVSLDALFKAKNKDQLGKAIDDISKKLNTWDEAHEKLQAAVDKYGFTVDQLGPKFRQQELDTQAGELLQDFELLKASGIDVNLILEKMAPNMSEYVQTAIKAGSTIPMAMKPVIDAMIANGELLDENGVAYKSAEEAGITFAQTMSEQFQTLIQKIGDLVAALTGIPNVDRTVTVNTKRTGDGGDNSGTTDTGSTAVPEDYRAASGFHAMVTRPTRILVGEAGPEMVNVTPSGQAGPGGGGATSITYSPNFYNDPLATNEARRDLSNHQAETFFRGARNDPYLRQTLRKGGIR